MTQTHPEAQDNHGMVQNATGSSRLVLVCEHASAHIPLEFHGLGLSEADRISHAAWDPGALSVAQGMARRLDAVLVAGQVSRLVYDCNRPSDAPDAMPVRSEVIDVPGNRNLTDEQKTARVHAYYHPFRDTLRQVADRIEDPIVVTIHSFTPTYYGKPRAVEIGVLHDTDARLAEAMLENCATFTDSRVEMNQPYGPQDGVTHTLREHAITQNRLNVMLEVRNDLIATRASQDAMAATLATWVAAACARLGAKEGVQCQA